MRGAIRGMSGGIGRAAMGDFWSDLLFNLNPSNSPIHNQFVTPIADKVLGIPLGTISNTTQQGMQDLVTGNFNIADIPAMFGNGGLTPTPKSAPASGIVSTQQQAPGLAPTTPIPWGKIALGGGIVLAVGVGAAVVMSRKKALDYAGA